MTETISVLNYYISFYDDYFEISMPYEEYSKKDYIIAILLTSWIWLPFLPASIICFVAKNPSIVHGVIFLVSFLGGGFASIWLRIMEMKQEKCYQFIVNEQGVTQSQVDKTYFIPWNEISSYGFVGNVKGQLKDITESHHHIYLIASKTEYSEQKLRSMLSLGYLRTYAHCSTDDLIAVIFMQTDLDEELKSRMLSYFHRYMGEDVEGYDKQ